MLDRDVAIKVALVATDHQQLLGDERRRQAVIIAARARRAVAGGIDDHHIRMLAAQPEKELLEQLFVAAHGDAGAQQGVHRLAMHVDRADAMDTPAPVEDARTVLDQVHRGRDIRCDAGV